jgi:hypothetical protein
MQLILSKTQDRLVAAWQVLGEAAFTFKDLFFAAWMELDPS